MVFRSQDAMVLKGVAEGWVSVMGLETPFIPEIGFAARGGKHRRENVSDFPGEPSARNNWCHKRGG